MKRPRTRGSVRRTVLLLLLVGSASACTSDEIRRDETRRPLVVFGIDGGEWRVVEDLWQQGRLPNLKRLAEEGQRTHLLTDYGRSPVIWTTIATGRHPNDHGITDFTVTTPNGTVPVSSSVRKVPALWNMTARVGLDTAVLGWWASWSTENITGIVVSDRADRQKLPDRVFPAEFGDRFASMTREALEEPNTFGGNAAAKRRDQIMAWSARALAAEKLWPLMLVYFRGVDIASHNDWKYYDPEPYGAIDPAQMAAKRNSIPSVYDATDKAIGDVLEAFGEDVNVLVVSDHGFVAQVPERTRLRMNLDHVLEALGLQTRSESGAIDCKRSLAYNHGSPDGALDKAVRFCLPDGSQPESLDEETSHRLRARLAAALAPVTFSNGQPAFDVRPFHDNATGGRNERTAHATVRVLDQHVSEDLHLPGQPPRSDLHYLWTLSGTHSAHTHGMFIAHGPDFDPGADPHGIHIHDIAPTVLYGLGLPVGDDFVGRAWPELYTEAYRRGRNVRRIPSWGTMNGWQVTTSTADQELVEELRALGYI